MRLVLSAAHPDVALSVYLKVKALGARPEGCQAKAATMASYLHLSQASVERGLTSLSRAAPDGVVELRSERRTLPGGTGTSAVRTTRPLRRTESFVWLPVAAAEDLTPRQLRAYAVIAFTEKMGIALTEGELAGHLVHHSGKRAGQSLSVAAAGVVVDELEAARWVSVQRRAGVQGRHRFVACDIAPGAGVEDGEPVAAAAKETVQEPLREPVDNVADRSACSLVGEGSGLSVGEGSLAYREDVGLTDPTTNAHSSSAVGEVPVVEAADNPADTNRRGLVVGGLALRAEDNRQPSRIRPTDEHHSSIGSGSVWPAYTGPALTMSEQIYAVLEPVHLLLARVDNPFVARKVAREAGRQLTAGTDPQRLRQRLTARFAAVMTADIRDPGRWLLGVALPRWGCGDRDCESGVRWSNGERCAVCGEVVADKFAARGRAQRLEQGLCLDHSSRHDPSGACRDCEIQRAVDGGAAALPVSRAPAEPCWTAGPTSRPPSPRPRQRRHLPPEHRQPG
ncbi:hypothetical protein ABZ721_33045 [Streptomyces sp. NPDC006733]|uniref:hypothetical protein n=1 Tax=Streptomyces sp. NPDC006733 TaxID=3155460 RepID=UPI0033CA5550